MGFKKQIRENVNRIRWLALVLMEFQISVSTTGFLQFHVIVHLFVFWFSDLSLI